MEKSKKKPNRRVIILPRFRQMLQKIYFYLFSNSPDFADKFVDEIDKKIQEIAENPYAFPPEKLLDSTPGGLIRFALYFKKWKIIYKIVEPFVWILGIVHTSQNPAEIEKLKEENTDNE
jgi:plasmid stabilization system protein ParE